MLAAVVATNVSGWFSLHLKTFGSIIFCDRREVPAATEAIGVFDFERRRRFYRRFPSFAVSDYVSCWKSFYTKKFEVIGFCDRCFAATSAAAESIWYDHS